MKESYNQFNDRVKKIADVFRALDKSQTIRIISHLDCDGICASSILIKALSREGMKYSISVVHQLSSAFLAELEEEKYSVYIFLDLGSGYMDIIHKKLAGKMVFILDHHEIVSSDPNGMFHLNPQLFGIDGNYEIAGAGVAYLFARSLNKKNSDMAHVALIGAIGDTQESNNFGTINAQIMEDAVREKKLKVTKGLRFFGHQTKPLYKILQHCKDPYIPGVSGSEAGAIQLLIDAGINPRKGSNWRKLIDLTKQEMSSLATQILARREHEANPEEIFGYVYTLADEEKGSPLRDAKEFATLLNACGRLGKASLGIGACLGNAKIKKKALAALSLYKAELLTAIQWFKDNLDNTEFVQKGDGYLIINAKDNIMPTIIGTLSSMIANSSEWVTERTYILSLARILENKTTKASLRIAGEKREMRDIDLRRVLAELMAAAKGECGGHAHAAGGVIKTAREKVLVEQAKLVLAKQALEELVH